MRSKPLLKGADTFQDRMKMAYRTKTERDFLFLLESLNCNVFMKEISSQTSITSEEIESGRICPTFKENE